MVEKVKRNNIANSQKNNVSRASTMLAAMHGLYCTAAGGSDRLTTRRPGYGASHGNQPAGSALMRAESRDSLRDTVLVWVTPFVAARCISGRASRSASPAASLLPLAIAASTFLMKVRIRDLRAALRAVRVFVCRMRLRAEAVLAMCPVRSIDAQNWRPLCRPSGRGEFYAWGPPESRKGCAQGISTGNVCLFGSHG
jgi:hypothetical protein